MRRVLRFLAAVAALIVLVVPLALPGAALAHERRTVGKYELVVGWMVEPAFAGEKNGLDLRVTNTETQKPVEGLENTLKAEVIFGAQKREFELRAVFRDPGHYTADIVPTRQGDYRFRFFGTIEGTEVNETFDSADGKFNAVRSIQAVHFPETVPPASEVARTAAIADQKATAAQEAASGGQMLAIAGVVLGAMGLLVGGLALARGRRSDVRDQMAVRSEG